ncbi:MAG: response regulator transcription factor [Granulosicoccus sp.]
MVAVLSQSIDSGELVSDEESLLQRVVSEDSNGSCSIAVNGTRADDISRIASLLSYSDVDITNTFFCESAQIPEVKAFAAVICHRRGDPEYSCSLPDGAKVSRIIVLSDCAREETAVGFLDGGARHFFNINEPDNILQARLEAALRQHRRVSLRSFSEGDIHFDVQKRKVTRADRPVDLSPKEFEFACHLFSRLDKVVRNSELMTSVWSLPPDMDTRRIDTAACRVRKKLRLCRDDGWELKRVRRVGYRLSRIETEAELVV